MVKFSAQYKKDCFIRYEVTAHFQCMEDRQKNGAGNERITAQDKKITCINSDSAGNGLYVYICFHSNERYKSHCERTTWKTRKFASASSSELMRWEQHMLFLQNHSLIHSMIQYVSINREPKISEISSAATTACHSKSYQRKWQTNEKHSKLFSFQCQSMLDSVKWKHRRQCFWYWNALNADLRESDRCEAYICLFVLHNFNKVRQTKRKPAVIFYWHIKILTIDKARLNIHTHFRKCTCPKV